MPELPEVETVRRQLAPEVVGERIVAAWARLERITQPSVHELVARTEGRRILGAHRKGKQLYFSLEGGGFLLVHLGMSGRLSVEPARRGAARRPHVHGVFRFESDRQLVFYDPRTFGVLAVEPDEAFLRRMGPDPTTAEFDPDDLVERMRGRSVRVKSALLDQRLVAGLGNIYADEVCFQAGVHPGRRLHAVSTRRLRTLVSHIRPVLERAIEARGATLKDGGYQDLFGDEGLYYPDAYGRTDEPCGRCGTAIRRGVLGSGKGARSYHYCPRCQR